MIASIDPGLAGAISIIDSQKKIHGIYPMPLIGKELNVSKITEILADTSVTYISLELVHAIFGCSAAATFSFGKNFGILLGILPNLKKPFGLITPKDWQKIAHVGTSPKEKAKVRSLQAFNRLFPDQLHFLTKNKKVNEGLIDATLIGYATSINLYGGNSRIHQSLS